MSIDEVHRLFGAYGIRVLGFPSKTWKPQEAIDFVETLCKRFDRRFIESVRFCQNHRVTIWMKHKMSEWLDWAVWTSFNEKVESVWPGSKVVKGPILHKPAPHETRDGREIWLRKSPRPAFTVKLPGRKRGRKSNLTSI